MTESVVFVGDVHGWQDRLQALLQQIPDEEPLLFLGDLIDRGPHSAAVVTAVRELCDQGRARCLLGNHEYAALRAFGVPTTGIQPDENMLEAWLLYYGGFETMRSYGEVDAHGLRMNAQWRYDLMWFAELPWLLTGPDSSETPQWYATHAGFHERGLALQVEELERIVPGNQAYKNQFVPYADLPEVLYSKAVTFVVPHDLPQEACVVSGHTPQRAARVGGQRWLLDTSGGLPDAKLSAARWPDGQVYVA